MKTRTILIELPLDKNIEKSDLDLRYILVDTIESRELGEVVEETSAPDMLEVVVEIQGGSREIEEIKGLISSLGFSKFSLQEIEIEDDDE